MIKKDISMSVNILCVGLILKGDPKKTVAEEDPSVKKEEGGSKHEVEQTKVVTSREEKGGRELEKSLEANR